MHVAVLHAANVLEVDSKWTKYSLLGEILAPELVAITSSANAEPFTLASKRGDVIMIDFWTFACINCIRTFPYLKEWHEKYADDGLIIVGVHYPEFDFERDVDAVVEAAKKYGLDYAIAQDNMGGTWRAYDNEYWPPLYLIDRQSNIRYIHIGEGDYEETDRKIRQMLAEPG